MFGEYTGTLRFIPTPQEGAAAWSQGVSGAQQKYTSAVQNTTADQAGRAVAQQNVMAANFANVVNSGEWARRVQARGTQYWKSQTVAKAGNYGASAQYGQPNYANAAQQLYPYEQQLQSQIDAMPKGTRADSIARFTQWMDGMITFGQQYTP